MSNEMDRSRPSAFEFEVIGFGSVTVMPDSSHARILFAAEVAAIGDDIEAPGFQRRFRLLGHVGDLRPVCAVLRTASVQTTYYKSVRVVVASLSRTTNGLHYFYRIVWPL
jgi:hypothetical protein